MKSIVVIPARYDSTRLPGKPLKFIGEKPMIQHVYERACKSTYADKVVVATDDQRVFNTVEGFGGDVVMTSEKHTSGTERVIEVSEKYKFDVYINVQGDEPFVNPEDIDQLIEAFSSQRADQFATLCYQSNYVEALQTNKAKVVLDNKQNALYFSRSVIPYSSSPESTKYNIHIGMYGYKFEALQMLKEFDESSLDKIEKLEQLKFLQAGFNVHVGFTVHTGPSVDTPSCLEKARNYYKTDGNRFHSKNLSNIKAVFMDVDGVLSPASLMFTERGEEIKVFDVRDGMGIKNLLNSNIKLAVISGRGSKALSFRLNNLGIDECHFNIDDKREKILTLAKKYELKKSNVLYIGDDINDLPAFEESGISCTVNDAPAEIKSKADIVLKSNGGYGAIRELSDLLISAIE